MHKDMLHLLKVYCQVVECKSFTLAAELLDLQPPAVSKSVAKLERVLGCKLLNRSTRAIEMTDAGELLFRQGREQLSSFEGVLEQLAAAQSRIQGTIRISATPLVGEKWVVPVIMELRQRYPELKIDLSLSNDLVSLPSMNVDIALRSSHELEDSSLFCKKLCEFERLLVASPAFLETCGEIKQIEDLRTIDCLLFKHRNPLCSWGYVSEDGSATTTLDSQVYSNSYTALESLCLAGAGVARMFRYQVQEHIEAGRLLPVLADCQWGKQSLHAVYHQKLKDSPKLNVFLQALIDQLGKNTGVTCC